MVDRRPVLAVLPSSQWVLDAECVLQCVNVLLYWYPQGLKTPARTPARLSAPPAKGGVRRKHKPGQLAVKEITKYQKVRQKNSRQAPAAACASAGRM